jgi:GDPmannose 4,6-dehydratase
MKIALITGITGQDGAYLAEFLLNKGYEVHGIKRRASSFNTQRIDHIYEDPHTAHGNLHLHYGDLTDSTNLIRIIQEVQPDEIYNLAAMSHVKISFDQPAFTIKNNSLAVLTLLEAMRKYCPNSKFYQASSSEMFGNSVDDDGFQRMNTPMHPVSPYGCAKLLAYNLTRHYRNAYKLHICNGILFNHESPRRGSNFVTNKIIKTAVEIKKGKKNKLVLGNLDAKRDWGHSYDYVRAMHKILNYEIPMDFIVSTGTTRSVRDLCEITFNKLGLNYLDYVVTDKKYMRPEELKFLCGDSSEIRKVLNWSPKYTFDKMIDEMIEFWIRMIF